MTLAEIDTLVGAVVWTSAEVVLYISGMREVKLTSNAVSEAQRALL